MLAWLLLFVPQASQSSFYRGQNLRFCPRFLRQKNIACGMEIKMEKRMYMSKSPLTTLCYIEKDGAYLMLHRVSKKNDVNKDKWIGVGGHFEGRESPEECLLREVYEETGLVFAPIASPFSRPYFSSVGMTDESCCLVFGRCQGTPTSIHQENTEDIQVVLADRAECRRILAQEQVAIQCAYMLMHFVSSQDNPFAFLEGEHHV